KDILNNEIFYVHNNQEIGPNPKEDSMTFIVTDKAFPRYIFKRAILVEEGQLSAVTEENLSATDEDTFPGELLIVITKQPEYGFLENSRPSPGYEQSKKNKKINAFPLQDVKDEFITFVQYNHSGIEPESDDFEVFVTDGVHNSTTVLVYVSIVLLNDEIPFFFLSNITVDEGSSFLMNNESIIAGDRDYPGDILVLSVKSKPKYGTLTHFLQAVNNAILYAEDTDSTPSEILFKITDTTKYGNLEKKNSNEEWAVLDSEEFSQEDINLNLIRYQQILKPSSTYEDSFSFSYMMVFINHPLLNTF
ncbi:FRAS1-related extracellular matrix protein 1, partial [Caerostris extrusa]